LPDRAAGYLGGDFANEYRKYIDAIVAPNKQAQVTNTTEVMGTAVETVTPTEATALVYTNSWPPVRRRRTSHHCGTCPTG